MPVALTGELGAQAQAVIDIVCASAAARTILGAADAAAAAALFRVQATRDPQDPPSGFVLIEPGQVSTIAINAYQRTARVTVGLCWSRDLGGYTAEADRVAHAINLFGAVLTECIAQAGAQGAPAAFTIDHEPPWPGEDSDERLAGAWCATLTFSWSL